MKVRDLISILSVKEKKFVTEKLNAKKTKKLYRIFLFINKNIKKSVDTDTALLYQDIYEKPYNKTKDYNLRNDLKRLNQTIKNSLIEYARVIDKKYLITDEIIWLQRILASKQTKFFEREWNTIKREKEKMKDFKALKDLGDVYFDYKFANGEINVEKFKNLHEFLVEVLGYETKQFAEEAARIKIKQKLCERVVAISNKNHAIKTKDVELDIVKLRKEEGILKYFDLVAQSYSLYGQEKIDVLLEILGRYDKVLLQRPDIAHSIFAILGTIGLEYFLALNYSKAHIYYARALKLYKEKEIPPALDLLFNYVINLYRSEQYGEVILVVQENYEAIQNDTRIRYRTQIFFILSYLIIRENEKAYLHLPHNMSEMAQSEYYSFKFCYIIYHYQTADDVLFENELNTLYKRILKYPPQEKRYDYLARLFKKFMHTILYVSADKRLLRFHKIQDDMMAYQDKLDAFGEFSITLWLKKEVRRLIKK